MAALDGDALSDLLFTSGTTGAPKGVKLTHAQTLRAFGDWADIVGLRADDRYLCINPFFHAFGYKAGIIASLMTGATLVPMAVFDLDAAVDLIESERITVLPGPPTIYQSLLNHPGFDAERVGSLRLAVTGAASVPVELVERMRERAGLRHRGHRVRPDRGIGLRHDLPRATTPPRRSRPPRAGRSPASRCGWWTTTAPTLPARRRRRGARARLQRDARLLRRPGADRRDDRPRTAGCTPATSA